MATVIKIATRKSPLARYQAEYVKRQLEQRQPELQCEIIGVETLGDRFVDRKLIEIGGKGVFVKALEEALLSGEVDIAVHSIKDMPCQLPEMFILAAVLERENPYDVLVSTRYNSFQALPEGAVIGTASPRRACQCRYARPDLKIELLRGNVQTRLGKLEAGEFDAIILAQAGLDRLKITDYLLTPLIGRHFIPAIAQGALGIECLSSNTKLRQKLACLDHLSSRLAIDAERAVNQVLGGSCHTAIGAYAEIKQDDLFLRAMVGDEAGRTILFAQQVGDKNLACEIGHQVGESLLAQGAEQFLR